jgi:hypothetical protein
LLKIRTWGLEWKTQIDKTNEWVAWWWANAKIDKESLTLLKQTIKIPKEDMEDCHRAMFKMPWISSKNGQVWKS